MSNILNLVTQLIEEMHDRDIQLVTVDSYDAGTDLVYVIRNGQTTPDAQGYPHVGAYSSPAAGHVVLLERVGTGYLVTGKVGPGGGSGGGGAPDPHDSGSHSDDYAADPHSSTAHSDDYADQSHASTHYEDGSDELDRVQTVTKKLTNKTGGTVNAGDVVLIPSSTAESFAASAFLGTSADHGVVMETIANNAVGLVALSGYVPVLQVAGVVAIGNRLRSSATQGKAQVAAASADAGIFAIALSAGTDTTVSAIVFSHTQPGLANHTLIDLTAHAVSGLTDNHFLRATGATTYAFEAVTPADLGAADISHAVDHATGGSDAITPADIGAADTDHDASNHTNRTRYLWIPATAFSFVTGGAPTLGSDIQGRYPCWLLDAATAEYIGSQIPVPADWTSGSITVRVYIASRIVQTTKAVVMNLLASGAISQGDDVGAFVNNTDKTISVIDAAEKMVEDDLTATIAVSAGELIQIRIGRVATAVADTCTGDLEFFGVRLAYTADG